MTMINKFNILNGVLHTVGLSSTQLNQINSITFRTSMVQKIISNKDLSLIQKQTKLENLNFITKEDIQKVNYELTEEERLFLKIIENVLLPENVFYWKGKNTALLAEGIHVKISAKRRKPFVFQIIFDFFQNFKNVYGKELFSSTVLYCIKSLVQEKISLDFDQKIMRVKFLTSLFQLLLKYLYAAAGNMNDFMEIRTDFNLISKFSSQILVHIINKYTPLTTTVESEGTKTITYLQNKNLTPFDSKFKLLVPNNLPMVVEPNQWLLKKKEAVSDEDRLKFSDEISFGGFKVNSMLFYPGIHIFDKTANVTVEPQIIETINYLQGNSFSIPYEKSPDQYEFPALGLNLIQYLETISKTPILEIKEDGLRIIPFHETSFFHENEQMRKAGFAEYKALFVEFIRNLYAFLLMDAFKDTIFWFPLFFDFRLRVYQHGWPLNQVLSNKLIRKYIKFNAENEKSNKKVIEIDATVSGISIMAGLISDEFLLLNTNILCANDNCEKKDFYTLILNEMKFGFLAEKYKLRLENLNLIEPFVSKLFLDRNFSKTLVMRYPYNEKSITRIKNITNLLKDMISETTTLETNVRKDISLTSIFLEKLFRSILIKLCPDLLELVSIFNSKLMTDGFRKNGVVKIQTKFAKISYFNLKDKVEKNVRTCVIDINGKKTRITNPSLKKNMDLDWSKMNRSAMPNWIHSRDSLLLQATVLGCKKENIRVHCVHDSFTVLEEKVPFVREIYSQSYFDNVLQTEFDLEHFFLINDVEINPRINLFLEKIKEKRTKILNKIILKELKFSPHILSE